MRSKTKLKIAVVLCIISFFLPILVSKLKTPRFTGVVEVQISSFKPQVEYPIIKEKEKVIISDPFKSERVFTQLKLPRNLLPTIVMIYNGKDRYAILDDSIVREGDKLRNFKIKRITFDKVLLVDNKGDQIWVKMENY